MLYTSVVAQKNNASFDDEISRLIELKKYSRAKVLIDSLISVYPNKTSYQLHRINLISNSIGRLEAIVEMERLLSTDSTNVQKLNFYSDLLSISGYLAKADSVLSTTLRHCETDTQKAWVFYHQSLVKKRMLDYEAANTYGEAALQLFPNSLTYLANLAIVHMATKDYEKVLFYNLRAYEIDKNNDILLNNIALTHSLMGNYKEAIEIYQKLLVKNPYEPKTLNNLGYAYVQAGKVEMGIEMIRESLNYWSNNSYAHKNLGLAYIKQKNKKQACICFDTALLLEYTRDYGQEVLELKQKYCK